MRAGEFRIIYAYNDTVVELLSLRRRNESTYDDLDDLEIQQFTEFRPISGSGAPQHKIPNWEESAKNWAAPQPRKPEPLPRPITPEMLDNLKIDAAYRGTLLQVRTVDDLLGFDAIPAEVCEQVLECLSPRKSKPFLGDLLPVVVIENLIDDAAGIVSGPIDTSNWQVAPNTVPPANGLSMRIGIPAPLRLVATRQQQQMFPYPGNTSRAVGNDKYTVKLDDTIQLSYTTGTNEHALLTTDGQAELVALVNAAKQRGGGAQSGGSFFINEYRHVLVPTQSCGIIYAGDYTRDLEFEFDGSLISPVAPSGIRPGDEWPGPNVGIKYVLTAGASDIRFDLLTELGTVQRKLLSEVHPRQDLTDLLKICRDVKPGGGALYINEARELFAPVNLGNQFERLYIGHLGTKPWFPKPV